MPGFSDSVLLLVNTYGDTSRQVKRPVYEAVLAIRRASAAGAMAEALNISEEALRQSPIISRAESSSPCSTSGIGISVNSWGSRCAQIASCARWERSSMPARLRISAIPTGSSWTASRIGTPSVRSNPAPHHCSFPGTKCGSSRCRTGVGTGERRSTEFRLALRLHGGVALDRHGRLHVPQRTQ